MIDTFMALWNRNPRRRATKVLFLFLLICISISLLSVVVEIPRWSLGAPVRHDAGIAAVGTTQVANIQSSPINQPVPTIVPTTAVPTPTSTAQVCTNISGIGNKAFSVYVTTTPTQVRQIYRGKPTATMEHPQARPTVQATVAPTATATPAMTATPTVTPTVTPAPSPTVTPSPTDTPTPQPTVTVTPSPTVTPTPQPTVTVTPSPTDTPTPTVTPTPQATISPTPVATVVVTPTVVPTPSPLPLAPANSVAPAAVVRMPGIRFSGGLPVPTPTPTVRTGGSSCLSDSLGLGLDIDIAGILLHNATLILSASLLGTALLCSLIYITQRRKRQA